MNIITEPGVYLIGRQAIDHGELTRFLASTGCETWTTDADSPAAALEGRRAIGVEIDPGHCDTIRRRIDEVFQRTPGSLFAGVES